MSEIHSHSKPEPCQASTPLNRTFSVAPMLDWTDRYCRGFHRLLTKNTLLYTEMVTTGALIHGDVQRHLQYAEAEHPIALQLGGSDPAHLAQCSELAQQYGYDEVNLNVGCPSDRVQSGSFGACLMAEPNIVADGCKAMIGATDIPVTVKCRIGIDEQDDYQDLQRFVESVAGAGVTTFIVHARKAWLKGLSPKQNRDIPPLNYERVYLLKREFPELEIIINGGIHSLAETQQHLQHVDGVMMGRAAYQHPHILRTVDQVIFGESTPAISEAELIEQLCAYIDHYIGQGAQLKYLTRHIVGLFQNRPGARQWRRYLSENAYRADANVDVVREAAAFIADLSYDTGIVSES